MPTTASATRHLRHRHVQDDEIRALGVERAEPREPGGFLAPTGNTSDGALVPSPRVTDERPWLRAKPLATATKFVGDKNRRTIGLGLVTMSMGGAIGFLIKIELGRLLRWPRRLGIG